MRLGRQLLAAGRAGEVEVAGGGHAMPRSSRPTANSWVAGSL
jgi:hypothetical protein